MVASREELQRLIDVLLEELGTARRGPAPGGKGTPDEIARMIDYTLLKPDATRHDVEDLCRDATRFGFATVCVNPIWVAPAAEQLSGSGVGVCTVVGFPLGAITADTKAFEARRAIFDGASEIDMVINLGALKTRDMETVSEDIRAVTRVCREHRVLSKVIIEAALLDDDEKVVACTLAQKAGADFVKTSTGFGPGGASTADVALMRRTVGPGMGVKAAGGIRDLRTFDAMRLAGANRIGTSAGVQIVQEARARPTFAAGAIDG